MPLFPAVAGVVLLAVPMSEAVAVVVSMLSASGTTARFVVGVAVPDVLNVKLVVH